MNVFHIEKFSFYKQNKKVLKFKDATESNMLDEEVWHWSLSQLSP